MRQRVMIAMALACDPKIRIADEPTTALDVTIQAGILDLLRELRGRLGTAIVLITHNLGVVADIADRVVVMYAGRKAEEAPVHEAVRRTRSTRTRSASSEPSRDQVPRITGGCRRSPDECRRLPSCRDRAFAHVFPEPTSCRGRRFRSCARCGPTTSWPASTRDPDEYALWCSRSRDWSSISRWLRGRERRRGRLRRRRRAVLGRRGGGAGVRRRVRQRQDDRRGSRQLAAQAHRGVDQAGGHRDRASLAARSAPTSGAACTSSSRIRTRR